MGRVDDIITKARDTLSEKTPKRWKTERLLRALTEGQKRLARELGCVREVCTIQLCAGYHTYKLDTTNIVTAGGEATSLTSAVNHAGKPITFVTTSVMSSIDPLWRTRTGADVTYIVYDKQKPLIFRVYPIPTTADLTETGASFNTTDEPFADAATICEIISTQSNFDITLEKTPVKIQVEFNHVPPSITTVADTNLLTPLDFDVALKHFVIGMTLRDDLDAQNRAFGQEELQLYSQQYEFAKNLTRNDFVDEKDEHYAPVTYNAEIK